MQLPQLQVRVAQVEVRACNTSLCPGVGGIGVRELFADVENLLVEVASCMQLPQLQVRVAQLLI